MQTCMIQSIESEFRPVFPSLSLDLISFHLGAGGYIIIESCMLEFLHVETFLPVRILDPIARIPLIAVMLCTYIAVDHAPFSSNWTCG
jgi:hypothetical protein